MSRTSLSPGKSLRRRPLQSFNDTTDAADATIEDASNQENLPSYPSTRSVKKSVKKSRPTPAPRPVMSTPRYPCGDSNNRSPFTPLHNVVQSLKERMEQQAGSAGSFVLNRISPGLAHLKSSAANSLRNKQAILSEKHQELKNRADQLCVGGGISLWPDMENMRLTQGEVINLIFACIGLFMSTIYLYTKLHGHVHEKLGYHYDILKTFRATTPLIYREDNTTFRISLLEWHQGLQQIVDDIQKNINVSLPKAQWTYQLCVVLYVVGIGILLYYLYDNIFAKSKLTPRRTKLWVALLVIISTWTFLLTALLVQAQALENAVEIAVHEYSEKLGVLVLEDLDLTTYRDILSYWTTRCLPPMTHGTLSIMGIVAVRDVSYYLQYYSWPVITALVTPIFRLISALKEVYSVKTH